MFYQNIKKYKKELRDPTQDTLRSYVFYFKHLMMYANDDDLGNFHREVKNEYEPAGKSRFESAANLLRKASFGSFGEYIVAFIITISICYIIIYGFQLALWTDLGSSLSVFVSFFLIMGGIKRYLFGFIKRIFSKENEDP
jgi:hypothetical protein